MERGRDWRSRFSLRYRADTVLYTLPKSGGASFYERFFRGCGDPPVNGGTNGAARRNPACGARTGLIQTIPLIPACSGTARE
jgi:hypothetical protein